jgi:hypothetical protein
VAGLPWTRSSPGGEQSRITELLAKALAGAVVVVIIQLLAGTKSY